MTKPPNENAPTGQGQGAKASHNISSGHHTPIAVDLNAARRFLTLLDETAESFHFRTFDDQKRDGGRKYAGSLDAIGAGLQLDNGKGHGVFVVVNEGGQNQKDVDVTRIRAVFADFDGTALPEQFPIEPSCLIESSPGKFHVYWLVDGLPVASFKPLQQAIAATLGSDSTVNNPSRVMRLPGFVHRKPADTSSDHDGKPFVTRIIHESGGLPYTPEQVLAAFPAKAATTPLQAHIPATGERVVATERHGDLLKLSGRIARQVHFDGLGAESALAMLFAEAERGRWTRDMPRDEIKQAFEGALAKLRSGEWPKASAVGANGGEDEQTEGAHDPCTHLANAHRLVAHFGNRLLFVEGIGWHTWSPPWKANDLGARRITQGLGKIIAAEAAKMAPWVAAAADVREREEREAAMSRRFKWASQSENAMNVELSLKMAQPLLSCKADEMDALPELLGLPGGVLDLRTGEHREHRQADRLTRTAGCDYDPVAACPTWVRFLGEVMGGDAELLDYLQRLWGYALSGMRGEHLLPIFYGSGANGKSTLLAAMQNVLGDYAGTAAPGLLIARGGNEHPTGLADLQGRRLVVVSETGETGRLNEEQVKALTGGDRITARRMRMDFYQFDPTHLLVMQTNHKPRVTGTDEGIWRRLRLIPFTVTAPPDKRDARLPEKLQAELPGILSWAVEGWRKYQTEGFVTPAAVTAATSEYRDASDQIGAFVAESCEVGDYYTASAGDLYKSYSTWCEEAGERPRTQREFGMRLSERGFEQVRTGSARRWRGLSVSGPAAFSDGSDGCDGGFGLTASKSSSRKGYSQSSVTSVTSVTRATTANDYRAAKDGGL